MNEPVIVRGDCSDGPPKGIMSSRFDFIAKALTGDSSYPSEACLPYYYGNFQANNVQINVNLTVGGTINAGGNVTAPTFYGNVVGNLTGNVTGTASGNKSFDIKHPTKKDWRLRHVCLEGPENGVYIRGRLTDYNIIDLPDYWDGLIDPETITVSLTQIGYSQDLIVEKIEWGKRIIIKSANGANIDCYYTINATRKDCEVLIPEYEGTTPADYPGNNDQYSVAGFHYDVRI